MESSGYPRATRPCIDYMCSEDDVSESSLSSVLVDMAQNGWVDAADAGSIESTCTYIMCDNDVWKGIYSAQWKDTSVVARCVEDTAVGFKTFFRHRMLQAHCFKELLWTVRWHELRQFKAKHGHCNVPARLIMNQQLSDWIILQRQGYHAVRSGIDSALTTSKIEKLESIGFVWSPGEAVWTSFLEDLCHFRDIHGHTNVPRRIGGEENANYRLGRWVNYQRMQYANLRHGRPSSMTEERIAQLEGIGFEWSRQHLTI